jgi:hypothetical protein
LSATPSARLAWADRGYAGKMVTWAVSVLKPKLNWKPSHGLMARTPSRSFQRMASKGQMGRFRTA